MQQDRITATKDRITAIKRIGYRRQRIGSAFEINGDITVGTFTVGTLLWEHFCGNIYCGNISVGTFTVGTFTVGTFTVRGHHFFVLLVQVCPFILSQKNKKFTIKFNKFIINYTILVLAIFSSS